MSKLIFHVPYERRVASLRRFSIDGSSQYRIIDFHTHSFVDGSIKWQKMWGWTIPFDGNSDELVRHMDAAGIELSVVLATGTPMQLAMVGYFGKLDEARRLNDQIARSVVRFPDRLIGFAKIPPLKGEEVLEEVERAVKVLRLRGIGHFGFLPKEIPYHIIEKAAELEIPIEGGSPEIWDKIAASYPKVYFKFPNFCLSQLHDRSVVDTVLKVLDRHPNVYTDIANTMTYQPELCIQIMEKAGFDKFVYGSDFPNIGYTADHDISIIERYSHYVKKIPDEYLNKLFWENSAKILGIK